MRCGGCHYQHAPYEVQLAVKRDILEDQLRRIGKIAPPAEIGVVAGEPWGYRNRVQLHIANGALGYRQAQSRRIVRDREMSHRLAGDQRAIAMLREMLSDPRWPRFVRSIELFTNETRCSLMFSKQNTRWRGDSSIGAGSGLPGWSRARSIIGRQGTPGA